MVVPNPRTWEPVDRNHPTSDLAEDKAEMEQLSSVDKQRMITMNSYIIKRRDAEHGGEYLCAMEASGAKL